jgi:amidase
VRPFRNEVGADPGRLRIGLMTQAPGALSPIDPECVAGAEATGRLLQSLGHHVEESHPGALDDPIIGQHFATMYGTHFARLLDTLSMFVGREIGADDVDPFTWALVALGRTCTAAQYLATVDWMHAFTRYAASWWADGFDLLLTPTLSQPPPVLGYFAPVPDPITAGARATGYAAFTLPFNLTGQPAISLPLHWSAGGLPVGMQLVAAYGREDVLLRVASQVEQARPWADRRPRVHASATTG